MQTELRVVNLGKRGGKVVRRFPLPPTPSPSPGLELILGAYLTGEIGLYLATFGIITLGYEEELRRCYPRYFERR